MFENPFRRPAARVEITDLAKEGMTPECEELIEAYYADIDGDGGVTYTLDALDGLEDPIPIPPTTV